MVALQASVTLASDLDCIAAYSVQGNISPTSALVPWAKIASS
jgi:hypothetical protein